MRIDFEDYKKDSYIVPQPCYYLDHLEYRKNMVKGLFNTKYKNVFFIGDCKSNNIEQILLKFIDLGYLVSIQNDNDTTEDVLIKAASCDILYVINSKDDLSKYELEQIAVAREYGKAEIIFLNKIYLDLNKLSEQERCLITKIPNTLKDFSIIKNKDNITEIYNNGEIMYKVYDKSLFKSLKSNLKYELR